MTPITLTLSGGVPYPGRKRVRLAFFPILLDWTNENTYQIDPGFQQMKVPGLAINGAYFDNSKNANELSLITGEPFKQTITIPKMSCVRIPFESGNQGKLLISSTQAAVQTQVTFLTELLHTFNLTGL